jgi:APA family basic amino acid/polyamine antiporter
MPKPPNTSLKRSLGLGSAVSLVIGSIIGAGIFMRPASMAARLGSPYMLLLVWLVAGAVSLIGAMIFAELGTMFPDTGGPYVYLQKIYGDFTAFIYGWSASIVINTTAIASIAFVAAQYLGFFIHLPRFDPAVEASIKIHLPYVADIYPLRDFGVKTAAAVMLLFLTALNYFSTRQSNALQVLATVLKTLAIVFLIGGILLSGRGHPVNFVTNSPGFHPTGWLLLAAFMAATSGAFSSYDGWYNLNMVAGELDNPQRNISRSLFIGLGACIGIYALTTLAYMYVIPVDKMAHSSLVAADAMEKVLGLAAAGFVSGLIVVSALGATNSNLIANIRVLFAMGEGGDFFAWVGRVHPRFGTPGNAAILMGVISIVFVYSGSFDLLADMFVFLSWIFYGLTGVGLFLLRRRLPDYPRPYRTQGYPVLPAVFVVFTAFYLVTTLYNDISAFAAGESPVIQSVLGLLLTAAGIPFYLYFQRQKRKHEK